MARYGLTPLESTPTDSDAGPYRPAQRRPSLAAVMWGMWKNQTDYQPEWVGKPAAVLTACCFIIWPCIQASLR